MIRSGFYIGQTGYVQENFTCIRTLGNHLESSYNGPEK